MEVLPGVESVIVSSALAKISARPRLSFAIAASLLLALAYAGRLDGEYVWDDVYLIEHNASLQEPGGLRRLLSTDLWSAAGQPRSELFHPLPMASFWLQARLGLLSVPAARLVDLALHLVVGVLLLGLLLRLRAPPLAALLLALVFVTHPSATEPVMWLTGRHDLLGALCVLVALAAWPRPDARTPWRGAVAAALACGAAFACKEPYVIAPALVLALAWAERAPRQRWLGAALPIVAVLAVFAWRHAIGVQSGSDQLAAPLLAHLRNAGSIDAHYGVQLLTLGNGATIETYRPLPTGWALAVLGGAAGLALVLLRVGARVALFGVAWFVVALAPHVLSLPLIGLWANRYAYFPLAGLVVLAAAACAAAAARPRPAIVGGAAALCGVLIVGGALRTRAESAAWRDDLALYSASVEAHADDGRALYHYAYAVHRREGCVGSMRLFAEAARLAPDYARAWRNLAGCLLGFGRTIDAIEPARRAVALEPGEPAHHYNLGSALIGAGRIPEGIAELQETLRLDPGHARARALLEQVQ